MNEKTTKMNLGKEFEETNGKLPINLADMAMPLDINIRSIALTIA
jgi:hypothetical protein